MTKDNRFLNISYDDFRNLAKTENLSKYERIGFPNSYREGYELEIFSDIRQKLTNLSLSNQTILDIGPGCSDLPALLINLCENNKHILHLIDSPEMLSLLPDLDFIKKTFGPYPNCPNLISDLNGRVNAILCYSVLHYITIDVAFFRFLDISLSLLAPGGQLLIGDIPNISKRKRLLTSEAGKIFHMKFMETNENPLINFNIIEHDQIDDSVIFCILQRARTQGFDAYVLPQSPKLPMTNRREDILIVRP